MANEKRVRANGVAGKLSADIAIAGTSMSSAGLADLPVVDTTNHAAITLFQTDSNGRVTKEEIVYVTAHTASATTATIVKAQESTTDQAWSGTTSPDSWVHAPTARDVACARMATVTRTANAGGTNDYTLNSTSWADLDATNLTVTVKAQVGDMLRLTVSGEYGTQNAYVNLDIATIVSAAPVHYVSTGGTSPQAILPWFGDAGFSGTTGASGPVFGGSVYYRVQSGDVSSGTVTLRLRYQFTTNGVATSRTLFARATLPLQYTAENLGPVES